MPEWAENSKLTLETLPSGQRGGVTVPARHFFSETLRLPGTGIATMRREPLYVGPSAVDVGGHVRPSWGYVGAMLPQLGPLLDHVAGDVGPSCTP